MTDTSRPAFSPFDIDHFAALFFYIHTAFVDLIARLPMDEDGDIPPLDSEALHSDLLCLLYDIEDEMDRLLPHMNFKQ